MSSFIIKLIKVCLDLNSIDGKVLKSFLIGLFEGSVMDGYITQAISTDYISVKTAIQGLIGRSAEQQPEVKAARAEQHRVDALAKVNMAIKHIEQCELCGQKDHLGSVPDCPDPHVCTRRTDGGQQTE